MGKIFDPDNSFWSVVRKILYMIVLSIAWCLCSIPLLTIGTSSSALYYAVVKVVRRERSYPLREFFKAFKQNLKRGTILTIIIVIVGSMSFAADIMLGATFLGLETIADYILCALFVLKVFILLGVFCYVFPLLSRFDTTILTLLESALFLCSRYLLRTICIDILFVVMVLVVKIEGIFIIIIPALYCLLCSFLLETLFVSCYDQQEVNESVDTWFVGK